MKLTHIEITNFMSIRSAELALDGAGLVLVQGENADDSAFDSNGAGKSTIFEAITYALFEVTVRGVKGDAIINEDAKKGMRITLTLTDGDTTYTIDRFRKHKEFKNATHIHRNGENISPKTAKDANVFIEQLIGMDYDTFTNSILFGQGAVKLFSEATDREKKAILERMLGMDVFSRAQEATKRRLRDAEGARDALVRAIETARQHIDSATQNITYFEALEADLRNTITEKLARFDARIKELEAERGAYDTDVYEAELDQLNTAIATAQEERRQYDDRVQARRQTEQNLYQARSDASTADRRKGDKLNALERAKRKYDDLAKGIGTECPTCGGPITQATVQPALDAQMAEMRPLVDELKALEAESSEYREAVATLEGTLSAYADLDAEVAEADAKLRTLESERNRFENRIQMNAEKRRNIDQRIQEARQQRAQAEAEYEAGHTARIEQLTEERTTHQATLTEREADLTHTEDLIARLEFWVAGFGNSGIKSYLLDSVTPYLNTRANHYLSKLSGNTTEIEFSTQTRLKTGEVRDKFEVRISNRVGGTSYTSNSTGEKKRIDLAISLALQDLVMSRADGQLNILLYDEVFDGLDAIGCENAIQLLQDIQTGVPSVFVITHNDVLKAYFETSLTATKQNGTTTLSAIT